MSEDALIVPILEKNGMFAKERNTSIHLYEKKHA